MTQFRDQIGAFLKDENAQVLALDVEMTSIVGSYSDAARTNW